MNPQEECSVTFMVVMVDIRHEISRSPTDIHGYSHRISLTAPLGTKSIKKNGVELWIAVHLL